MTPILSGRIQTRLFTMGTVGLLWTLLVTPLLPGDQPLDDTYRLTLAALLAVTVIGCVVWEPLYHLLQQFRWEKDWPALFVLLEGIPEGVVVFLVLPAVVAVPVAGLGFTIHFATTWLVAFVWIHGPMRVPFLRWRFRGGRVL